MFYHKNETDVEIEDKLLVLGDKDTQLSPTSWELSSNQKNRFLFPCHECMPSQNFLIFRHLSDRNLAIQTDVNVMSDFKYLALVLLLQWPPYCCADLAVSLLPKWSGDNCCLNPAQSFPLRSSHIPQVLRPDVLCCSGAHLKSWRDRLVLYIFSCCFTPVVKPSCCQKCVVKDGQYVLEFTKKVPTK